MTTKHRTIRAGLRDAGGILDRIVEVKMKRLEETIRRVPLAEVIRLAATLDSKRKSFATALKEIDRINIIAEIKQRSPSKGIIRQNFNPMWIASSYEAGGAAAVSVLAEEDFFGGSLEHIGDVRRSVDLPLLRKDFIFDEYQLYESVVAGADAVLLIVAILDDELLVRLLRLSAQLELDALVEVHSGIEMERAVLAGAKIIGVNNRNLSTFKVDLGTSLELASFAPKSAVLVSESGINTGSDIRQLRSAGFNAFLIGEHLMRAEDPGYALKGLVDNITVEAESLS